MRAPPAPALPRSRAEPGADPPFPRVTPPPPSGQRARRFPCLPYAVRSIPAVPRQQPPLSPLSPTPPASPPSRRCSPGCHARGSPAALGSSLLPFPPSLPSLPGLGGAGGPDSPNALSAEPALPAPPAAAPPAMGKALFPRKRRSPPSTVSGPRCRAPRPPPRPASRPSRGGALRVPGPAPVPVAAGASPSPAVRSGAERREGGREAGREGGAAPPPPPPARPRRAAPPGDTERHPGGDGKRCQVL